MKVQILGLALAVVGLNGAVFAQDTKSADKTFIKDSAQDSLAEISLAKLALEKSQDANVRKFAAKMVTDHEKLIASMKPFAAKYGVTPPSGPSVIDKAKYEALKLKSGTSFDRAYVEGMVKDHHEDLDKFLKEENSTADPELKATVAKGEKVIAEHTQMIDGIAHMGGISTPAMPNGSY